MVKKFKIMLKGISIVLLIMSIVLLIMIIINFGMDWCIFDKFGNGSDDGWLGFWGGFLGAIFAVVGVWWQTNKTITNEKELMFSQKRPYIVIRENSTRNDEMLSIYVKKKYELYGNEPIITLKNLSNNPMFSVKLVVQYDNKKEEFVIDRIEANSNIGIVINSEIISERLKQLGIICPTTPKGRRDFEKNIKEAKKSGIRNSFSDNIEALKYFNIGDKESEYIDIVNDISDMSFKKYDLLEEFMDKYIPDKDKQPFLEIPDDTIITIYFTTTVREKVKLVFKKDDKKYRYQKNETKLENKGGIITEGEYDTSDMYESYKLK